MLLFLCTELLYCKRLSIICWCLLEAPVRLMIFKYGVHATFVCKVCNRLFIRFSTQEWTRQLAVGEITVVRDVKWPNKPYSTENTTGYFFTLWMFMAALPYWIHSHHYGPICNIQVFGVVLLKHLCIHNAKLCLLYLIIIPYFSFNYKIKILSSWDRILVIMASVIVSH